MRTPWPRALLCPLALAGVIASACADREPLSPHLNAGWPDAGTHDDDAGNADASSPGSTTDAGAANADADSGAPTPATEPCPKGLGALWTCDGARRVRCVDGVLAQQACENGCAKGDANEALCSCGSHVDYTRWNCTPAGDRASCAGGLAWSVASCGGLGCAAGPAGTSDTCNTSGALQDAVATIGASCGFGLRCALAVRNLTTGARAGHQDNALFVSASSAKAIWVGAALHDKGIALVEPHVKPIFEDSDNLETGAVIDLLTSPDRLNTFQWQDGALADIGFCSWNYGADRVATNCPGVMHGENFFSAGDAASYLAQVWDHSLLGAEKSNALLSWMKLSPREGYGGWLGTQLPSAARASMHHKAGWRPPGSIAGYENANANEIGIIEIPNGPTYAVAILIDGDVTESVYDGKALPLLEYMSCAVYHAVAGDDAASCTKP